MPSKPLPSTPLELVKKLMAACAAFTLVDVPNEARFATLYAEIAVYYGRYMEREGPHSEEDDSASDILGKMRPVVDSRAMGIA